MWKLFLLCLLCTSVGAFFDIFKSKVCYDVIGCFDNSAPFTNSWYELPDSPEKVGVTLTLYTRSNPLKGEPLNYKQPKSVVGTHFDPRADTKVIIHGYLDDGTEPWVLNMTRALLQVGGFNVIKVAWGPGAHDIYPRSVANTRVIGAVITHFLTSLQKEHNVSMTRVHLLGHSLGAHIAGYVGSAVRGVGRISGMDPAGPLFESTDIAVRIDPSDAAFVDCIHSDGVPLEDFGFGTMSAWCDVDFYPNGGQQQPGCKDPVSNALDDIAALKVVDAETAVSCSHSRSHDLYVDSINRCQFRATPCDSYRDFLAGRCTCNASSGCLSMGYHAADGHNAPRGTFYLNTTASEPFC